MALRKGAAGARLEVALEANCSLLVSKFDEDVKFPETEPCRVRTAAVVVVHQSGGHIGSQAHVEACSWNDALEDVGKSSRAAHGSNYASPVPQWSAPKRSTLVGRQ
jgi:hypothetical protein